MRKLTLVNAYLLSVKFSFFVHLNYKRNGELDIEKLDLREVLDLLGARLNTTKPLHPVIVIGSCWVFPKFEGEKNEQ